jgi:hypothetical protein
MIAGSVSAIALGKPYDMPIKGAITTLTKEQQTALIGTYKLADDRLLSVAADGDSVSAEVKDHFLAGLIPLSATSFYMPMSDGTVTLSLGADGKARSVNLHYKGEDHRGQIATG